MTNGERGKEGKRGKEERREKEGERGRGEGERRGKRSERASRSKKRDGDKPIEIQNTQPIDGKETADDRLLQARAEHDDVIILIHCFSEKRVK